VPGRAANPFSIDIVFGFKQGRVFKVNHVNISLVKCDAGSLP
jgi:hypothetical protein